MVRYDAGAEAGALHSIVASEILPHILHVTRSLWLPSFPPLPPLSFSLSLSSVFHSCFFAKKCSASSACSIHIPHTRVYTINPMNRVELVPDCQMVEKKKHLTSVKRIYMYIWRAQESVCTKLVCHYFCFLVCALNFDCNAQAFAPRCLLLAAAAAVFISSIYRRAQLLFFHCSILIKTKNIFLWFANGLCYFV